MRRLPLGRCLFLYVYLLKVWFCFVFNLVSFPSDFVSNFIIYMWSFLYIHIWSWFLYLNTWQLCIFGDSIWGRPKPDSSLRSYCLSRSVRMVLFLCLNVRMAWFVCSYSLVCLFVRLCLSVCMALFVCLSVCKALFACLYGFVCLFVWLCLSLCMALLFLFVWFFSPLFRNFQSYGVKGFKV